MMKPLDKSEKEADTRLDALFRPKSVAIIGASRKEGSVGRTIMKNILSEDFAGTVYPVNPQATSVFGVRAYPSVLDIPDPVEMAVVVVPAEKVLGVVDECGRKGLKALVIISAGFREIGGEGAEREQRLKELLVRYGMRALGPNCMGLWNSDPAVRLNVTFSPVKMRDGDIAFVSQSGALGMAILDIAQELGIGLSYFVSMGNKVNISGNDLLMAWEHDPRVRLILMYLENFGNPRRFVELSRRIVAKKPVIVVKSGRSSAGARAARSHTGALSEQDVLTEALFEQCGVIRAQTIEELFEYARLFTRMPPPRGHRVAIVTNSGGPGILAADALSAAQMTIAPLEPETTQRLQQLLPGIASTANPVDMTASAGPQEYAETLNAVMRDPNVDAAIVIFTPPTFVKEEPVANAILRAKHPSKPLLACVLKSSRESAAYRILNDAGLPTYTFPESAVRALAGLRAYAQWQMQERGNIPEFPEMNSPKTEKFIHDAVAQGQDWLNPETAMAIIAETGIRCPRFTFARTEDEAHHAFATIGPPVVLKAIAKGLIHRSDVGAVRLNVQTPDETAQAFRQIQQNVIAHGFAFGGVLMQEQILSGREVIVGANVDPLFGPLMMFGLGGKYVEVLRDVVFRLAPLTDRDAERMVRAIRGYPILEGVRGEPPSDIRAIEDTLLRISALVMRFPQIAELEINPLAVLEEGKGAIALDVRIKLWPHGQPPRAHAVVPEIRAA